jgi:hypothetical protein
VDEIRAASWDLSLVLFSLVLYCLNVGIIVCVGEPVCSLQSRAKIRISEFCQLMVCSKSNEGEYFEIRYTGNENIRNVKHITEFTINSCTAESGRVLISQILNLKINIWKAGMLACYVYIRFMLWCNAFVSANLAMEECNITRINQSVSPGRRVLGDINYLVRCEDRGDPISPTANLKLLTKVASDFEKEDATAAGIKKEDVPKKKELQLCYVQQHPDENFKSRKDKSLSSLCSKYMHLLFATKYEQ